MRTYQQLLDAVIASWPSKEEVAQLDEKELATLRGASHALDNILFLATEKGRSLVADARNTLAQKAARTAAAMNAFTAAVKD